MINDAFQQFLAIPGMLQIAQGVVIFLESLGIHTGSA